MPYFVYILFSCKDKKLYVGCTANVETRLTKHNSGSVPATKYRRPLKLVLTEKFDDKGQAFQRERFLKSLWSAREKKKILSEYLNKVGRNK
jgi:putative endonuclease